MRHINAVRHRILPSSSLSSTLPLLSSPSNNLITVQQPRCLFFSLSSSANHLPPATENNNQRSVVRSSPCSNKHLDVFLGQYAFHCRTLQTTFSKHLLGGITYNGNSNYRSPCYENPALSSLLFIVFNPCADTSAFREGAKLCNAACI